MTGPFLRVQETKLYEPTWVNVARIVKIQRSSSGTTLFLEGAGAMQIAEPADVLVNRLAEALAGQAGLQTATPPRNGARRARSKPAEEQHG
jgi:hypothetical protein